MEIRKRCILVVICIGLTVSSDMAMPSNSLIRGRHLKVISGNFPPSIMAVRNASGSIVGFSGPIFERLRWLSERLRFNYTLYASKDNLLGAKVNGRWEGMIGQLERNEVDLALGPFALNSQRYEAMQYAVYLGGSGLNLVVKYPESEISQWAVLQPFTLSVWMGFISSAAAVSFMAVLIIYLHFQRAELKKWDREAEEMMIYLIGTISGQGGYLKKLNAAIGVLSITWCLAAFVFVNAYSSMLTSYLSANYKIPQINSLEELALNADQHVVILKGSIVEIYVMGSSSVFMKKLKDKYAKCTSCSFNTIEDISLQIREPFYSAFLPSIIAYGVIQKDFEVNGKCHFTLANVEYGWQNMFMGVPKSSPYIEELNRESYWLWASGLVLKWKDDTQKLPNQCLLEYNSQGEDIKRTGFPLKLKQLSAAFYILLGGLAISIVVFIAEVVISKLK